MDIHGKCLQNILVGNLRGRDHLGDLGVNGRIILNGCLKYIFRSFEMLSANRRA
jgi:hypothetical protein